ncbi:major facilitator superfamily domain-containing protein [Cunninghamella echinulata]|nr:major facilitator superfamily domain-containing protein [Cunninghamella echinulata]
MLIGTVLAPLGIILSSFSTELWHIYLSQGVVFGVGCGLVFAPSLALPSQWFEKNRSLATGLAVAGSGLGGLAISPMSQSLIVSIGYRNAIRAIGAMGFGILIISTCLAFSKYLPGGVKRGKVSRLVIIDTTIIDRNFLLVCAYCFFIPFGYLAPFFLVPQYVSYLGGSASQGATLVSIMSAMNSICRIVMGFIADRMGKFNTMVTCTFLSGLFSMLIWQFSFTLNTYIGFCILYGLVSGVFVSLLPVILAEIVGVENIQRGIGMSYTITLFGSLLGAPVSGALKDTFGWTAAIQFSGAPTILSGIILLYLRMSKSRGKIFTVI